MDLASIRALWKPRKGNTHASVALWNAMADDFKDHAIPSFEDDAFLHILEEHSMFTPESRVLDVACGAGAYSIALADRVHSVVGIDISPDMVAGARERAAERGIENVRFIVSDWREFDLSAEEPEQGFDLVFAHMTPAIDAPDVFEKLSHASTGWCAVSKPTRRHDPVSDAVRGLLGVSQNRERGDADIAFGFCLLWAQERLPYIHYEETTWHNEWPVDRAQEIYVNRMRTYRDLSDDDVARIDRYLESIADAEGRIAETTDVTIATMCWHV